MNSILILLTFTYLAASTWAAPAVIHPDMLQGYLRYSGECKKELNANDTDFEILKTFHTPKNGVQSALVDCLYRNILVIKNGKITEEQLAFYNTMVGNDKNKLAELIDSSQKCFNTVEKHHHRPDDVGKVMALCMFSWL